MLGKTFSSRMPLRKKRLSWQSDALRVYHFRRSLSWDVLQLVVCRIWAKLRDEGWGEDIDWMSSADRAYLSNMKVACRPSKLTERSTFTLIAACHCILKGIPKLEQAGASLVRLSLTSWRKSASAE